MKIPCVFWKIIENNGNSTITQIDNNNLKEIESSKDNTIVESSKLPRTGISSTMVIMILSFAIIMIVMGVKSRRLKDIK